MRVVALGLAAVATACGGGAASDGGPCARGARLTIQVVRDGDAHSTLMAQHADAAGPGVRGGEEAWSASLAGMSDAMMLQLGARLHAATARHVDRYVRAADEATLAAFVANQAPPPAATTLVLGRVEAPGDRGDAPYWRTYLVESAPIVDTGAITDVRRGRDPITNRPLLVLTFTAAGRAALGDATTRLIGHKLAVTLDDHVVVAPVIAEPITGGGLNVPLSDEAFANDAMTRLACVATPRRQ